MKRKIESFREQTKIQEEVLTLISRPLELPIFLHSGKEHFGFVYTKPDAIHFCLLKAIKAVSGLNATIVLCEHGYPHEIAVLIRTIVESTTHIEYVLAGLDGDLLMEPQRKYVEKYFADSQRNSASDFIRPRVRQGDVHKVIGDHADEQIKLAENVSEFTDVDLPKLLSNVYLTFSNYVHGRYPEIMDMYGGAPSRFHVDGMLGTKKDSENLAIIETYIETVSLALKYMVVRFGMVEYIRENARLYEWYQSRA